jgi:hypothetical protein
MVFLEIQESSASNMVSKVSLRTSCASYGDTLKSLEAPEKERRAS